MGTSINSAISGPQIPRAKSGGSPGANQRRMDRLYAGASKKYGADSTQAAKWKPQIPTADTTGATTADTTTTTSGTTTGPSWYNPADTRNFDGYTAGDLNTYRSKYKKGKPVFDKKGVMIIDERGNFAGGARKAWKQFQSNPYAPTPTPDTSAPTPEPEPNTDAINALLPNVFPNIDTYYDQATSTGQKSLNKLLAARGLTQSGAEIEGLNEFNSQIGAERAGAKVDAANINADRLNNILQFDSNNKTNNKEFAWQQITDLVDRLLAQSPTKEGANAAGASADIVKQLAGMLASLSGGGGGGSSGGGGAPPRQPIFNPVDTGYGKGVDTSNLVAGILGLL